MATIVHRRPAARRAPEAPRGPGGSFDSLTWVGYASLVAAFGSLVFGLRPLADMGDVRAWSWDSVATMLYSTLRVAALAALPAALEWGVPGARRLTPWLMRGAMLLALEQVARAAVRFGQEQYMALVPEAFDAGFDTPFGLALVMLQLAVAIIGLAGVWALSDGLADAGARPRRILLIAVVGAGTAVSVAAVAPMIGLFTPGAVFETDKLLFWLNVAGLISNFVGDALWIMVSTRLVAGLAFGLRPRPAWILGALAAVCVLVVRVVAPAFSVWIQPGGGLGELYRLTSTGYPILLMFAFLAGLGRGRVRRRPAPRRMRLFVLNPTS